MRFINFGKYMQSFSKNYQVRFHEGTLRNKEIQN